MGTITDAYAATLHDLFYAHKLESVSYLMVKMKTGSASTVGGKKTAFSFGYFDLRLDKS